MKPEPGRERVVERWQRPAADDQTTINALRTLAENQQAVQPRLQTPQQSALGRTLPSDVVQLMYLVVAGCSAVAFALGFWFARFVR